MVQYNVYITTDAALRAWYTWTPSLGSAIVPQPRGSSLPGLKLGGAESHLCCLTLLQATLMSGQCCILTSIQDHHLQRAEMLSKWRLPCLWLHLEKLSIKTTNRTGDMGNLWNVLYFGDNADIALTLGCKGTKWPIATSSVHHTTEPLQSPPGDTAISLLHKAHVGWLAKLPCSLSSPVMVQSWSTVPNWHCTSWIWGSSQAPWHLLSSWVCIVFWPACTKVSAPHAPPLCPFIDELGVSKLATAELPSLSFTTALRKPVDDVTDALSIFIYGHWLTCTCWHPGYENYKSRELQFTTGTRRVWHRIESLHSVFTQKIAVCCLINV